jgi:hypothetical protein
MKMTRDNGAAVHTRDNGQILMPFANGNFIHPNRLQMLQERFGKSFRQIPFGISLMTCQDKDKRRAAS